MTPLEFSSFWQEKMLNVNCKLDFHNIQGNAWQFHWCIYINKTLWLIILPFVWRLVMTWAVLEFQMV